jgi:hypothetical protein
MSKLSVAAKIRRRIRDRKKDHWRVQDFQDLPPTAVSKTLSRLTKEGYLTRVSKGIYHRPRPTRFGVSRSRPAALRVLLSQDRLPLYPAGISAANQLGLTTQNTPHGEFATPAASVPVKLLGEKAKVYTRRPDSWKKLQPTEAAILDTLRNRGVHSDLSPQATIDKILDILRQDNHLSNILATLPTEPPRVQAIMGAIAQTLDLDDKQLTKIRKNLNPYSRFDFGLFKYLPHAKEWQAK